MYRHGRGATARRSDPLCWIDAIALARKAGKAVCGFERTKEALWSGRTRLLFAASDGSEDGKSKLRGLAESARIVSVLSSGELGLAFGRDFVIHAALLDGGATTLSKGAGAGQVRQSFSHGRSKTVVVETKKKRVVTPKVGGAKRPSVKSAAAKAAPKTEVAPKAKAEAKAESTAAKPKAKAPKGGKSAVLQTLSDEEYARRVKALDAAKAADTAREKAAAAEAKRVAAEEKARLAAEKAATEAAEKAAKEKQDEVAKAKANEDAAKAAEEAKKAAELEAEKARKAEEAAKAAEETAAKDAAAAGEGRKEAEAKEEKAAERKAARKRVDDGVKTGADVDISSLRAETCCGNDLSGTAKARAWSSELHDSRCASGSKPRRRQAQGRFRASETGRQQTSFRSFDDCTGNLG